jgi:hypothetical protein
MPIFNNLKSDMSRKLFREEPRPLSGQQAQEHASAKLNISTKCHKVFPSVSHTQDDLDVSDVLATHLCRLRQKLRSWLWEGQLHQ